MTALLRQRPAGQDGRWRAILAGVLLLASLAGFQPPPAAEAGPRLAPVPSVSIAAPGQIFLGQSFSFTVTIDNSDADEVGYGPIIDLLIPVNGQDGSAGAAAPDGIDFVGATYLGVAIHAIVQTFPDDDGAGPGTSGCLDHPFYRDILGDPLTLCGTAGDKLVVLELPFGSFSPDQPPVDVTVDALLSSLADLDAPLTLRARGGFRYGADPLDNWCCDPVIVNPPSSDGSGWPSASVTPTLIALSKTYSGPEDETATGPNYPRRYTISADIALGQSLMGLTLEDDLPGNLQFASVVGSSHPIASCSTPSPTTPGGTLSCLFAGAVSGTITLTFEFLVPLTDLGGADVLPPLSGDDRTSSDESRASASWTPIDGRDPVSAVSASGVGPEHILNDRSIAVQKSVSVAADTGGAGPTPGDTLQYSLAFQVSDFFAFEGVVVTDTFSDGQLWDAAFAPTLSLTEHGAASSGVIDPANVTVVRDSPGTGDTTLTFRVSDELVARAMDGLILGGCVPAGGTGGPAPDCGASNGGATTGVITFRTVIQDEFTDEYPSGDPSVDQGDELDDVVDVAGAVLATDDLNPTGQLENDGSGAGTTIARGQVSKTIYAVNGAVWAGGIPQVAPGDTVTYRITYRMPASDFEDLRFQDYLPLPVLRVDDPDADGAAGPAWSYSGAAPGTIPASGVVGRGSLDDFTNLFGVTPAVSSSPADNSLALDYGTHDDPANRSSIIDLLFTVRVNADPFADGLFLTNQARQHEGSTNAGEDEVDVIIQIQVQEPVLFFTKGVGATDNPAGAFAPPQVAPPGVTFNPPGSNPSWTGVVNSTGLSAQPIDSNLSDVDAGDLATFALVIENQGSSPHGAFDIRLRDLLAPGYVIPSSGAGLNLQIRRGNRDLIGFQALDASGTPVGAPNTLPEYLFYDVGLNHGGLEMLDPSNDEGVCQGHNLGSGANIVILTYDLQLAPGVEPNRVVTNTASVTRYASRNGGPSFLDSGGPLTDQATVTTALPGVTKTVTGTNQAHTLGNNVAIGEQVTYQLVITVPEGVANNVTVVDTLDAGLAFVSLDSLTASADLSTSIAGGFPQVLANARAALSAPGSVATYSFGTLSNANRVNTAPETITITYTAVVLNSLGNDRGVGLNNNAVISWTGGSASGAAPNVTIVEPTLQVTKAAAPNTGDAGDTIAFTLAFSHTAASNADAFNVMLTDPLPAGMTYVAASLNCTSGVQDPDSASFAGGVITASWTSFLNNGTTGICTFQVTLNDDVEPGQVITNTANLAWTSLPGDVTTPRSTLNGLSTERTGDTANPGGAENDYRASGPASVTILQVPDKTLAATSESHTGDPRVAIGEIVRYHLAFQLAEGIATNLRLQDELPAGMQLLNDGTAMVAFVSNGPGITSTTITAGLPGCAGLVITGNSASVTPTCPLPDTAVSSSDTSNNDTYGSGTDVYLKLGTLDNRDRDVDAEYAVVEFNALVENVGGNTAGQTLSNDFIPWVGTTAFPASDSLVVTVAVPGITLAKAVTTVPSDAGDTLVYTLTATNASGANVAAAFDLSIVDTIDPRLAIQSVSGSTTGGACGATPSTFAGAFLLQQVTATATCLNSGGVMTVIITTRVVNDVQVGSTIPNTADLAYTTLPGANGTSPNPTGSTTPGGSGSPTGERVLTTQASASRTLSTPAITKLAPSPLSYTIGDLITYNLRVTLPEGRTVSLRVWDTLPAGLGYVSHSVITTASGSGGLLASDYNGTLTTTPTCTGCTLGASGTLTFDFGTPQTNGSGPIQGTTNDQFLVRVVAQEMNVFTAPAGPNADGNSRTNTGSLIYQPGSTDVTIGGGSRTITIIEPRITTTKSVLPAAGVQAGDTLTYTVRFTNTGNSPAYDVTAQDTLAQGVSFSVLQSCVNTGGAPVSSTATPAGSTVDFDGNPAGSWDIAVGGYIQCTYTGVAQSSLIIDGAHTNSIDADWSSQDGTANAQDRQYTDGIAYPFDASQDTASVTFTVDPPVLTKSDGGLTGVVIGQTISYTLTINSPLGTLRALTLTDTLLQGLIYEVGSQAVAGLSPVPTFSLSGPNDGSAPTTLTWSFGDAVVNTRPATITFTARLANVASNQNGVGRTNAAALAYTNVDGAPRTLNASDGLTVREPELRVVKTADDATPAFGQMVTYTIVVSHAPASTADAQDVVVTDIVPADMTYVAGTASAPAGWTADESLAPTLVFRGGLPHTAGPAVFTYQATVGLPPSVSLGDVFINTADGTWTSIVGSVSGERTGAGGIDDYVDTASETVTVSGIDLRLTKDDGGVSRGPGDTIPYSLTVENIGNAEATGVVITETVPAHTAYSGAPGWSCLPDNSAGSSCTYALGTLAGGASQSIAFVVVVDDPLPSGVTLTANTAGVTEDGSHGIEPTPADNSDSDTTPLVAAPDLRIVKDDGLSIVAPGSLLVYTLTYSNVGDQEATGVVIGETVPAGTTFRAAASAPTVWSCADGSLAGTACLWDAGDLPVGGGGTLTFAVAVTDPPGVTQIINTATIADDGANGPDQTPADNSDTDTDNLVTLPDADLTKTVAATSQLHTSGLDAAIGEILTYQVVMTVPPGTASSASLTDTLDRGLAFVHCLSLTPSGGLTTDHAGGFADACANPTVAALPPGAAVDQGRQVTFDLGSLDNPGSAEATLTLLYRVVALDIAESGRGDAFSNRVRWTWTGGDLEQRAAPVTVVEPTLTLTKTAAPTVVPPGAPITIRLTVAQDGASDSDAFDLGLTDHLPPGLTFVGGLAHSAGLAPSALTEAAGTVRATWDSFPIGASSTIEFQAALEDLPAGTSVRNEAALEWTSLPDDDASSPYALSLHNEFSTERRYDPTTGADFYRVLASASVSTPALPATGFAPGRRTALAAPPEAGSYQAMDGVRLIIPELEVDVAVVGVPTDEEGWDLSWLGSRAGYLYGTAYPTVPGNSAVTAHVYLPNGRPGPFVHLADLSWDDEIIVIVNGLEHVYRVRQVLSVAPDDLSVLRHEEYSWLTLITCQGFDEARDSYRWRVAVRAVLVQIRSP